MNTQRDTRLKWFSIDPDRLCEWLAGRCVLSVPGLPQGVQFVAARDGFLTRSIEVLVSHPDFEEVPLGHVVPHAGFLHVEVLEAAR